MKKIVLTIITSAFCILTLNACSTIDGVGKDLQGAGQSISKEAKKAKRS